MQHPILTLVALCCGDDRDSNTEANKLACLMIDVHSLN